MRCRFIVFVVVASLTGCEVDAIHSREVPKLPLVAQRTLAVLVPRDDATWFFKISGPESAVRADQTAFDGFVGSVTFAEGDKPVRWTLPDGWRLDPGGKSRSKMIQRYATLRTSNGNEILITRLGAEPGTRELLGNVNRWRREIGLGAVAESELPTMSKVLAVAGVKSTRVDLLSPGKADEAVLLTAPNTPTPAETAHAAAFANSQGMAKPRMPKIAFQVPAGWSEQPAMGLRAASFRVGNGDDAAEVTVIPLAGPAGGVARNVNLWRGSLQLPEISEAEAQAAAQQIVVDGRPEAYFDLAGPNQPKRQRVLAVIVPRGDHSWFIKMRGHAATVGREKANFESFVRSLKIPGGG